MGVLISTHDAFRLAEPVQVVGIQLPQPSIVPGRCSPSWGPRDCAELMVPTTGCRRDPQRPEAETRSCSSPDEQDATAGSVSFGSGMAHAQRVAADEAIEFIRDWVASRRNDDPKADS